MARKSTRAATVKTDEQPMARRPASAPSADSLQPINTGEKTSTIPQPDDDMAWLFDRGLSWLANRTRQPEAALCSLINRWLKRLKDDATALLRGVFVESGNAIEPIGWITRAVEVRAKNHSHVQL